MRRTVLAVLLLACPVGAAAGDIPELIHNPFDRPDLPLPGDETTEVASNDWPGDLRATLVDGSRALANVNGQFLAVGDEVDGARVTHIGEGTVTLVRGDEERTLSLHPQQPEEENE